MKFQSRFVLPSFCCFLLNILNIIFDTEWRDIFSNTKWSLCLQVLYNVLQMCAFIMMAVIIMRLKLFATPQLCLVAGVLASRKVCPSYNTIAISGLFIISAPSQNVNVFLWNLHILNLCKKPGNMCLETSSVHVYQCLLIDLLNWKLILSCHAIF